MSKFAKYYFAILIIAAACTCGARTECDQDGPAQISLLTSIHDDGACQIASSEGVLLSEASKLLLDEYNAKTNGFKLDIEVLDTCGTVTGALKASMKALVSADLGCLQPPHYLGFIGPDSSTNAEAVQKLTSVLRVPHLVRNPSTSAFLHHLATESNAHIVEGILAIVERLKWKSFALVAPVDDSDDDDVQNIAKKLTVAAIARNICVLVNDDDEDDSSANIVHIGKPDESFIAGSINATIIIASEGSLEQEISGINSTNTIILLEDERNEPSELRARVEQSKWWSGDQSGKYDPEELREVRWLQDAIELYGTALDSICKKKKCKTQVNLDDWNEMITKLITSKNAESASEEQSLDVHLKSKDKAIEKLGEIRVKENVVKVSWIGIEKVKAEQNNNKRAKKSGKQNKEKNIVKEKNGEEDDEDKAMPEVLEKIAEKSKNAETETAGCVSQLQEAKLTKNEEAEDQATHVVVSEMDDSEWWTMVGTVSGVGVAMFVVGILAVYIVYVNIRGPRSPKIQPSSRKYSLDDDPTLRRVGSDREMSASAVGRNQRSQPRRNNNPSHRRNSVQSEISDRSV